MNRSAFLLAFLIAAGAAGARPDAGVLLDSYAALVNGKVVTVGDVLAAMPAAHERLAAQYSGRELEEKLREKFAATRDALVEAELVLLDFEAQGGTLPDRAVEDHVNSVIHDQFGNDRIAFLEALAEQRLTYAEWHKQMKDQLVVQVMRQKEVAAKVLVTPLDVQRAYEEKKAAYALPERVRLRTYVLPAGADEPAWCARLRAGDAAAVPADVAVQDDGEAIETASLNEAIRAAVAALEPGGVSPPVEIEGARYLVQLVAREPARVRPLEEVAGELEKQLRSAEFARLNQAWIESLRAKYYVQTFDHALFD
ncbi:MAG TPA: peptidyl-prolyl cis-trans isomerase [Kiritimatiellia bacterium]|nr:peptidyl-prolyl cis-trans isomerase [Kiritimatiellia bacterium]